MLEGEEKKKSQSDNLVTWLLVYWYLQERLSLELVNAPYNTKYSLQWIYAMHSTIQDS